jgi:formylglycine-generating enzyme required for sulfatase activity
VTGSAATLTVNPLAITLPTSLPLPLAMTPIAAGTFRMGDASIAPPAHWVTISQNYYMGTYLLTQAQWQAVIEALGSGNAIPSYFSGHSSNPVEQVSYNDITPFLAWLNTNSTSICPNCPADYVFRLPTEAEWEYACRAGTTTAYYWGDDASGTLIGNYAWYDSNSGDKTQPVGLKAPNAWGLCDMAGNVFEWCQDWYGSYDSGSDKDPVGPASGSYRVLRGGCWGYGSDLCRSAFRLNFDPDSRSFDFGFRVVLAPPRTPTTP